MNCKAFVTNIMYLVLVNTNNWSMHFSSLLTNGGERTRERKKSMSLLVRFDYIHYCTSILRLSTR